MDAATTPSWITLLIQVPLVGVFIWYSLEMAKRSAAAQDKFLAALDKRDEQFTARNKALIETMERNNQAVCSAISAIGEMLKDHDQHTREYIASQPKRRA